MVAIIWSERAIADIEAIRTYIARDDTRVADRFVERLLKRGQSLQAFPLVGASLMIPGKQLREVYEGNYRLIYRVESDFIYIVTVVHSARLLDVDDLS